MSAFVGVVWIVGISWVIGLLAMRGRRRALRRGTYPLRLLPWYLGGPPDVRVSRAESQIENDG